MDATPGHRAFLDARLSNLWWWSRDRRMLIHPAYPEFRIWRDKAGSTVRVEDVVYKSCESRFGKLIRVENRLAPRKPGVARAGRVAAAIAAGSSAMGKVHAPTGVVASASGMAASASMATEVSLCRGACGEETKAERRGLEEGRSPWHRV
jgi:hypothetical protein